jgi:hypothetical protein
MKQDDAGSAPMLGSQPVAWAVMNCDGHIYDIRITNPHYAPPLIRESDTAIPLVPKGKPALTDAERTCLGYAIRKMDAEYSAGPAGVLRELLERLG